MSFKLEKLEHLAKISLEGNAQNTLTKQTMAQLIDIFNEISQDKSLRVALLLSGHDKVFSYGLDPSFLLEQSIEGRRDVFITLMDLIAAADELEVPLITDINGPALAGGAVLAMLGDFSIANDDHAKLCFSEVKVGIPVPSPIFELLRRRCLESVVREMLLLGKNMKGRELESKGIVSSLYHSQKDRDQRLEEIIGRILRLDRSVLTTTLKASKIAMKPAIKHFLDSLNREFIPYLGEDYMVKGLKAVLTGTSPQF